MAEIRHLRWRNASRHIGESSLSSRELTMVRDTAPFAPRNFLRKPQLISRNSPSGMITGAANVGRTIRTCARERSASAAAFLSLAGKCSDFLPIS